jgi:hypothetical protein
MSTGRHQPVVDVAVVLPGDWWVIDLQGEAAWQRGVRGLVKRQFAGVDDQPVLRAQVTEQLTRAAARAASAGSRRLCVSLQRVAEVPVPATLSVYLLPLGIPEGASHLDDLADEVLGAADTDARSDTARVAAGPVLRRVRTLRGDDPVAAPSDVPVLTADYWLEMPDGDGLAQLTFSTPMVAWAEPMLGRFDAVVGTAAWVRDEPTAQEVP